MKAFYVSIIILVIIIAVQADYHMAVQSPRSTSPLNPGPLGSQEFYRLLKSSGYNVELGDIRDLGGSQKMVGLLIVGPDKELGRGELELVMSLWERGRLILVAADETKVLEGLYRALGVEFDEKYVVRTGIKGWEYVVGAECLGFNLETSKVSTLKPRGAPGMEVEVVCRLEDGRPIALYVTNGASRAVLLGDSSIFANFLLNGYVDLKPTRQAALAIVEYVGLGEAGRVIYDISHYNTSGIPLAGTIRASIVVLASLLEIMRHHNIEAYKVITVIIASSTIITLLTLGTPITPPKAGNPLIKEAIEYAKTIRKEKRHKHGESPSGGSQRPRP